MATSLERLKAEIESVDKVMAGALTRFGELGAAGNKQWTLFARITSGSWAWRFQARLRALSNAVELLNKASSEANVKQLESIKVQTDLQGAFETSRSMLKKLTEAQKIYDTMGFLSPDYFGDDDVMQGIIDGSDNIKEALQTAIGAYSQLQKNAIKARSMNKLGIMGYYKEVAQSKIAELKPKLDELTFGSIFDTFKDTSKKLGGVAKETLFDVVKGPAKLFGAVGDMYSKRLEPDKESPFAKLTNLQMKSPLGKLQTKFIKGAMAIPALLKRVLPLLGKMLMGFALYGILFITVVMLLVGFFRKAWPAFSEIISKFKPIFELAFDGLMDILGGVFDLIVAIWEGRWWDAMRAFFIGIIGGAIKLLTGLALGIMATLVSAAVAMSLAIIRGIAGIIKKFIPGYSKGGVTQGGLNIVGERGPELVKLPAGSRVMSNANSRGMGGNTINVHVNGRVGASDAEIRDIANKVAREINIRMNRQGTTTMGG